MNIAKLDLYNPEWLELVFDDKNKDYGAYDLRKHYAQNQVKAMLITFFGVALLLAAYAIFRTKPTFYKVTPYRTTITFIKDYTKKPITPPATVEPPRHHEVATTRFPVLVARPDKEAENPPKIDELKETAIGTENKKGTDNSGIDIPFDGQGKPSSEVTEDTKPKEMYEIQVLPQPIGGEGAWAKFLQKNLHYPPQAVDAHAQGKVFLSFIVEKDGHISDVVVERGVGYGLDEEAVRVLKLAPAWKPGIQNGHQVRVKFTMPISFQINDPD